MQAPPTHDVPGTQEEAGFRLESGTEGGARLVLTGTLDIGAVGRLWGPVLEGAGTLADRDLEIDVTNVVGCEGSGLALLAELRRRWSRSGLACELQGASEELESLWSLFDVEQLGENERTPDRRPPVDALGESTLAWLRGGREWLEFIGHLALLLVQSIRSPRRLRLPTALRVATQVGAEAAPLLAVVGFLMGLVLAFEAATLMKRFGAELYVANLVSVSMLRELGPLMTAIVLAGRSGSAFAAELGTMKVQEEIDALVTMGLEPRGYLVLPRMVAAVAMTPLMSIFLCFCGLIGGAIVLMSLGYPLVTYTDQVKAAVDLSDLFGGLLKASVLGILVAAIGCQRGMQTGQGATAVGVSTTRAVVTGIVAIAVTDGVFSFVYYALGI